MGSVIGNVTGQLGSEVSVDAGVAAPCLAGSKVCGLILPGRSSARVLVEASHDVKRFSYLASPETHTINNNNDNHGNNNNNESPPSDGNNFVNRAGRWPVQNCST